MTHGISEYVGSVEVGKLADLVLWQPALFGAKPEMVLKYGTITASRMGEQMRLFRRPSRWSTPICSEDTARHCRKAV